MSLLPAKTQPGKMRGKLKINFKFSLTILILGLVFNSVLIAQESTEKYESLTAKEGTGLIISTTGKEIADKVETKDVVAKRLEAIDAALTRVSAIHPPQDAVKVTVDLSEAMAIAEFPKARRKSMNMALWFIE